MIIWFRTGENSMAGDNKKFTAMLTVLCARVTPTTANVFENYKFA